MDFRFSTDGDLELESSALLDVSGQRESIQLIMCTIASVSHDWFYDNIGCDLEQLIGEPCSSVTLSNGANIIFNTIMKTKLYESEDVKVESKLIDKEYIGYNVYIRDYEKPNYYYVIEVGIDLIKGISVRLGDEKVCLY